MRRNGTTMWDFVTVDDVAVAVGSMVPPGESIPHWLTRERLALALDLRADSIPTFHDDHTHTDADGADGRDAHAS